MCKWCHTIQCKYKSLIKVQQSALFLKKCFMCLSTFNFTHLQKWNTSTTSVTERAICKFRQGRQTDRKRHGALAKSCFVPVWPLLSFLASVPLTWAVSLCAGGNGIPVTGSNGLWRTWLIPRACIQRAIKAKRGQGQAPETVKALNCVRGNVTQVCNPGKWVW